MARLALARRRSRAPRWRAPARARDAGSRSRARRPARGAARESRARAAARAADGRATVHEFTVNGMGCEACEAHVRRLVEASSGVVAAAVDFETGRAVITAAADWGFDRGRRAAAARPLLVELRVLAVRLPLERSARGAAWFPAASQTPRVARALTAG